MPSPKERPLVWLVLQYIVLLEEKEFDFLMDRELLMQVYGECLWTYYSILRCVFQPNNVTSQILGEGEKLSIVILKRSLTQTVHLF